MTGQKFRLPKGHYDLLLQHFPWVVRAAAEDAEKLRGQVDSVLDIASAPLKKPRMGRVHPEPDRALPKPGIDLIDGAGNLFAACQLCGA